MSDRTRAILINAHDGQGAVTGEVRRVWGVSPSETAHHLTRRLAPTPPSAADFLHPDVGWGLVLPEAPGGTSTADKARALDAPEAIRTLRAERGDAPVFRYTGDWSRLRADYADGTSRSLATAGTGTGTAQGRLPRFLLIYATPEQIPWELQYRLQTQCCVGRLHLEDEALDRYVAHLLGPWAAPPSRAARALTWATAYDPITRLMREELAAPIHQTLDARAGVDATYVGSGPGGPGGPVSGEQLVAALAAHQPSLVVTTSHGSTPYRDPARLAAELGVPVGEDDRALDLDALFAAWQPDGAVWYAHACCSAGSTSPSAYRDAVVRDGPVDALLQGIAAGGSKVAPLPTRLLSADRPARAFIGQVEPTFDWTLRERHTGQTLTASLRDAIDPRLFYQDPGSPRAWPLAHAFQEHYAPVSDLLMCYQDEVEAYNEGGGDPWSAFAHRLVANDRLSLVVIGDPAVALAPTP